MKHRLTCYSIRMLGMRRKNNLYYPSGGRSLAFAELINDARHTIMQGSRDLARRGTSNREGRDNRRWRKYLAANPPPDPRTYVTLGDLIDLRDYRK